MLMKSLLLAAAVAGLFLIDARKFSFRHNKKEARVYGGLLLAGFVLCELYVFRVPVMGINEMISYVYSLFV